MFNKISKLILLILLCITLSSCYRDLTKNPKTEDISQKWFELKQDVFLCHFCYKCRKNYTLERVRIESHTSLPYSIQEYKRDPLNWKNTDSYAKCGWRSKNDHCQDVEDVISKGTKIYIAKIIESQNIDNMCMEIIAYLDHPKYNHIPINLSNLIHYSWSYDDFGKFEPNLELLDYWH